MEKRYFVILLATGILSFNLHAQHNYDNQSTIYSNNGKVGIGISSPAELLEIRKDQNTKTRLQIKNFDLGSAQETGLTLMSQGVGFDILSYNSSRPENLMGLPRAKGVFLRTHSGSPADRLAIGTGSNAPIHFATADAVRMTIDPTGKVGIGTTDFTGNHKLRIEGSIGAREIKVEATGWSDFVFEKDYELRTLEEVEQHINENGHLPEIPSEVEVTENGINLGEMDAKLLQKIEELTLYLIEQNKQLEKANQNIADLQREVSALKNE